MYIEIGTLWYLLFAEKPHRSFAGESPESRRKLLELNFFWKLEIGEKYDVMVVSGIVFEACRALNL